MCTMNTPSHMKIPGHVTVTPGRWGEWGEGGGGGRGLYMGLLQTGRVRPVDTGFIELLSKKGDIFT